MKKLVRAKTQQPVVTGEVVRDRGGRRYYVSHVHNNKVAVVSMDEQKLQITAKPEVFDCFLSTL